MSTTTKNTSPHAYVLATFFTAIFSFYLFYKFGLVEQYFFIPILILGFLYGVFNFIRQHRIKNHFKIDKNIPVIKLIKKAIARYIVWLAVIYSGQVILKSIPFYNTDDFEYLHIFYDQFIYLYLVLGIPYFLITLVMKSSRIEDFYDPAIRLIHISKQLSLRILRGESIQSIFFVLRKKYNRKVLLTFLMRGYFIPVMVPQIYYNLSYAIELVNYNFDNHQFLSFLFFVASVFWLMDTINASLAYTLESRWIENRTRSIDLTVAGWLVCLSCYTPLNQLTGSLFPWAPSVESENPSDLVFGNLTVLYVIKVIELLVLMTHIYADVSLGPSVANISLKKLQTRGLYGIIRHPGTTLKLLFFLIQSVFYRRFWQIKYIFGYLMWGTIYILRALTEERHLSHFAEYRDYKKKVKYRFLPKLF
jgi:protein-S-isoprenylcysteine O-methyltransferase Ste14